MMCPLSIAYINIRGLTNEKWNYLTSLMKTEPLLSTSSHLYPLYDILFVAETWFVDHASHLDHPLTFTSSPNMRPRTEGRQYGGVLLLVSPPIREQISSYATTEYSITIHLSQSSTVISAVYYPPSLTPSTLASLLEALPSTDILLGDTNIHYGKRFNDKLSGPPARRKAMDLVVSKKHWSHLVPSAGRTRIDHVFVSPLLVPSIAYHVNETSLDTDHPMIHLTLQEMDALPTEPSIHTERFYLKYLSCRMTAFCFGRCYDTSYASLLPTRTNDLSPSVNVDALDQLLLTSLTTLCDTLLGSYMPSEVQRQSDRMTETLSNTPTSYSETIRLFKRSQRCLRSKHLLVSRDPEQSCVQDAVSFYKDTYASTKVHPSPPPGEHAWTPDPSLLGLFTPASVKKAILEYPAGKSPGMDAIDAVILKTLATHSSSFVTHLTTFFSVCVHHGTTPARWNESLVFPIPKDMGHANTIDKQRPISLTVIFRRIFEKVLLNAITMSDSFAHLRSFHPSQAGFRRGFSTLAQALVSHEASIYAHASIKVFIDLKQAYDRVPTHLLLRKLSRFGASSHLVSLIQSLFSSCSSRVIVNAILSPSFNRGRGLLQGSLLSPWLFNVFIDDLACSLNAKCTPSHPLSALFFADDIQLQPESVLKAQCLLDQLSLWLSENQMEPNLSKCGILSRYPVSLRLSGQPIPSVASYTYLGFPHLVSGIDWIQHVKNNISKTERVLMGFMASGHISQWSELSRLYLYKAFIRPALEYGAPLVANAYSLWKRRKKPRRRTISPAWSSVWKDLESLQNVALGWIFNIRPFSLPVLRSITALGSLSHRFQELSSKFTYHLNTLSPDMPLRLYLQDGAAYASSLSCISKTHPLRTEHERISNPMKTPFSAYLLCKRLDTVSSRSKLASYISSLSRTTSGIDKCLLIRDPSLRSLVISWRRNTLGAYKLCPCGEPFRRSHLTTCFSELVSPMVISLSLSLSPLTQYPNYTILDELVNTGSYHEFSSLWSIIDSLLTRSRGSQ